MTPPLAAILLAVFVQEDLRAPDSADLKAASARESPALRRAAVRAMGRIQSPAYLPALEKRLKDADPSVKEEAVFALGQLGISSAAAALGAQPVSPAVIEALGRTAGPEAEPKFLAALASPNPALRREGALALFRLRFRDAVTEFSTASVRALVARFADKDPETRWRAVYVFSRWPEPRAAEGLAKALADDNLWARFFAARALGQLKGEATLEPLLKASHDAEYLVRTEAVRALGLAGQAKLLDLDLAEDASVHVRAAFAEAVGRSGDPAQLVPLEYDVSPMVRAQVLLSEAKLMKSAAASRLKRELSHPHWWVRSRAYLAFAELPAGEDRLREGLHEPDQRIAGAALEGLVQIKAPSLSEVLGKILADPASSMELRGTAADAAAVLKWEALKPAVEAALKNSQGREWYEVRDALNKALGRPPEIESAPAASPLLGKAPKKASVALETEKGTLELELFPAEAPVHVASFLESVRSGLYTNTVWHRIVSGFVIQGGDPRGSGMGDAGFSLRDEVNRVPFERGTLGMPKAGKDTGGCQIFITHVPTPHLDGRYTVFGKVVKGLDVVDLLEPGDKILAAKVLSVVP